jgi:hypothetical protein
MKNYFRRIILTGVVFLLHQACIVAQDKYEYGMISYVGTGSFKPNGWEANVSLNGKYEQYKGKLPEGLFLMNLTPLTKIATELNAKEGWEVYDQYLHLYATDSPYNVIIYYIRRKIK